MNVLTESRGISEIEMRLTRTMDLKGPGPGPEAIVARRGPRGRKENRDPD